MSQQEPKGPYIYQPYGMQDRGNWQCKRIYGIGGLHLLARIDGLTKEEAEVLAMIERAGILLPMMYRLGYDNANCIGCPKGGQAYWQNIRADFPERFVQIQAIQESIGPGASFLRFRSGPRKNERMSLAELPEGRGDMKKEPNFSCSFFCQMAEESLAPPEQQQSQPRSE